MGLAGSANIGTKAAMFEAIHGSAPDIAGKDVVNPCGLLNASVMMLNYLGLYEHSSLVHNALLKTIEDGVHTKDIEGPQTTLKVGTKQFTRELIARLGDKPTKLVAVDYAAQHRDQHDLHRKNVAPPTFSVPERPIKPTPKKEFVGVDIFVDWDPKEGRDPEVLSALLLQACGKDFKLKMISNRGVVVWPGGHPNTNKVDHWRCRFESVDGSGRSIPQESSEAIVLLLGRLLQQRLEVIKTENLYNFDGEAGYSKGQGQ